MNSIHRSIVLFFFMVLVGLLSTSALVVAQQTDNGSFAGTVTDPNKQVVPGASITVTNLGTGAQRSVTTNEQGRWTVAALPLGQYLVKAEEQNFQPVQKNVTVTASTTTTVDLTLGIEAVGVQVDIFSQQERSTLISSDSSPVTQSTITGKALETAPV